MQDEIIRVRIAPSPTGDPHVGTAYIAIFNKAFAKKHNGKFILRIEDTDRARSTKESELMIYEALKWLGLDWDEGPDIGGEFAPYRQSERIDLYRKFAEELVQRKMAYYCFCSPERLEKVRQLQAIAKLPPGYDRHCRNLSAEEIRNNLARHIPYVIRLKVPEDGKTEFTDLIRGKIEIDNKNIDDQVLLKSDGFPTYHLANVVDDHLMKINYVIRAEEWISSTPKHVILYNAFNWPVPKFAHMPLLRNPDRSKISKRKNPTSLIWYRNEGYLPEALINFLALLGFTPPDSSEIFDFQKIVDNFDFNRVNTSAPIFDIKKLDWLNGVYIRKLPKDIFIQRVKPYFTISSDTSYIEKAAEIIQERLKKLKDINWWAEFFYREIEYDVNLLTPRGKSRDEVKAVLEKLISQLTEKWTDDKFRLEELLRCASAEYGWKVNDLFMLLRIAITYRKESLPLCESMIILGKDECIRRLKRALNRLMS